MKNKLRKSELFFFRSIRNHFRKEFLKPWKEFRKWILVFAEEAKNTSEEAPFLLVRFLLSPTSLARGRHCKENEEITSQTMILDCTRIDHTSKNKIS
ncbi:MAG: hypothetical protein AAGC45_06965 [Bacteroidota bacterium]